MAFAAELSLVGMTSSNCSWRMSYFPGAALTDEGDPKPRSEIRSKEMRQADDEDDASRAKKLQIPPAHDCA